MWKRKKKVSLSFCVIFVCLTAAQYSVVRWSRPIQWSIHFLYIHQSTYHRYLFILCGPGWLECLHSLEWEKRKVSFLCTLYFTKTILLGLNLGGVAIGTTEAPPSADILWTGWWEMFQLFCLQKFKNVWLIRSLCCWSCPADWACYKGGKSSRTALILRVHVCENARHLTEYLIGNGNNLQYIKWPLTIQTML